MINLAQNLDFFTEGLPFHLVVLQRNLLKGLDCVLVLLANLANEVDLSEGPLADDFLDLEVFIKINKDNAFWQDSQPILKFQVVATDQLEGVLVFVEIEAAIVSWLFG